MKSRTLLTIAEFSEWVSEVAGSMAALPARISNIRTWHKMTGVEFENYIMTKLRQEGFIVRGTPASGDEGIDIIAIWQGVQPSERCLIVNPARGQTYLIRCKRYGLDDAVGQPTMREFCGSIVGADRSAQGIFVTTSRFTESAISYAQRMGIRLIDGKTLDTLLTQRLPEPQKNAATAQLARDQHGTGMER